MQQVRFFGYVAVLTLVGGFLGAIVGIMFDWLLAGMLGGLLLGLIAGLQMAYSPPGGLGQGDGGEGGHRAAVEVLKGATATVATRQ